MNVIRTLQRAPDGDSVFRVECRDDSIVFDVQLFLRAGEVLALDDVRSFFPNGVYVALFNQVALKSIVCAQMIVDCCSLSSMVCTGGSGS